MKRGVDQGYFPNPDESLFILGKTGQEEAVKKELPMDELVLNLVSGSRYIGAYLGP